MTVEQIIDEIKALSPEEQGRLRDVLTCAPPASSRAVLTEEEVNRRFVEAGILRPSKQPRRDLKEAQEAFDKYQPVPIRGKPLSETIIEERR